MSKIYNVILCGGVGKRLWPYSTIERPKQFLSLDGKKNLLQMTIDRCRQYSSEVWAISYVMYSNTILKYGIDCLIEEPYRKNTGPAILLSCLKLKAACPDATVIFMPSDHVVPDIKQFADSIMQAVESIDDNIALLGLRPSRPAVEYGYIKVAQRNGNLFKVVKFKEKPSLELADYYYSSGEYFWNMGIFIGKVQTFIDEFIRYEPVVFDYCDQYLNTGDANIYNSIDPISIDYGIMEKSNKTNLLPVEFEWYDIGDIQTFEKLKNKDVVV